MNFEVPDVAREEMSEGGAGSVVKVTDVRS